MDVYFSRHARRRAKLYELDLGLIADALQRAEVDGHIQKDEGQQQWQIPTHAGDEGDLVLKVIFVVEHERINVVTVYPLRKRLK